VLEPAFPHNRRHRNRLRLKITCNLADNSTVP
jgi:hypothetical protein